MRQIEIANLYRNIETFVSRRGIKITNLSKSIGKGQGYLGDMIANGREPGATTLIALTREMGCSLDELFQPPRPGMFADTEPDFRSVERLLSEALEICRRKAGYLSPDVDEVLRWWLQNNGRMVGYEQFEQFIETFYLPEEDCFPKPHFVGHESLAAREFGFSHPEELRQILERSDHRFVERVGKAHRDLPRTRPQIDVLALNLSLGRSRSLRIDYKRLLLPCIAPDGTPLVLNYSKPIQRREVIVDNFPELIGAGGQDPVISIAS